ncbi:MAG: hypothetical protein JST24_01135 [Acidobacteria bacterium]|nr:hypothetical protein [Acidobacteriota bacterium]
MLRRLLRPLWAPADGFRELALDAPSLRRSLGWMLAAALPWKMASTWFGLRAGLAEYAVFRDGGGAVWQKVYQALPDLSREDIRQAFGAWPAAPGWEQVVPWVPLLALAGLFSLWLHDGVWDHAALWLLRGLKSEKATRVKATLAAEAQAQAVAWIGSALGLLAFLPGVGDAFSLALLPLTAWLWLLRGWALSAHHGCPPWKGVVATLLHLVLFGLFMALILLLPLLLMAGLMAAR